ncbi:hypothetical protein Acr_00g0029650 [Actinidia rufa]|uniref:Uncharacterized protein n=1 Tax=Actinidia rufa TaxID=165716 RepID=A0A7J0DGI6_9ERIC|nr:hypothetical protein Acr_00g0029650 [Actinidia rufa]
MLLCAEGAGREGYVFGGSAMVLVRAPRDLTESGLELVGCESKTSLGTTIGIKAKFESPESHRSDFGGERKPISNSDQIRHAQKWSLSISPDSSRRDEAPAPNRVKIGCRTHLHAPPEVLARQIHGPHARPRAPEEGDDGRSHPTRSGTTVAEQNERVPDATKKRSKEEAREEASRRRSQRRDKKNCPRNKAQDQSLEAATTAMMAVDESDVLLAASADKESNWISDSGNAYHLCRDREVFSTHVACEGLVWMANDAIVGKGQSRSDEALKLVEEHSEFPRETGNAAREGRLKSYTDWRGVSRQEELLSDIDPVPPLHTATCCVLPVIPQGLHFTAPVFLSLATFSIYRPQSREDELMAELIRASILDHGKQPSDIFSSFPSLSSALSSLRLYQRLLSLTNATKNASRRRKYKMLPRKICKIVSKIRYPHPRATSLPIEVNALLNRNACTLSLKCPASPIGVRCKNERDSFRRRRACRCTSTLSFSSELLHGHPALVAPSRVWPDFRTYPKHLFALLFHCGSFKYIH